MKQAIKAFFPIAEAIQRLLHPHAEVVVHDVKQNKIAAIFNPFSKRRVGDSSLLTKEEEMLSLEDCLGPYEKLNWDGRKLKSVSSVIRDKNKHIIGLLCINLDISQFEKFQQVITEFINYKAMIAQPEPLFKDDWQERINNYIHNYLTQQHLSLTSLTREEKKALIEHLYKIGAFNGKHSAQYIASVIKVSRATVYNYLSQEE